MIAPKRPADVLRELPLFAGLARSTLDELTSLVQERHYRAQSLIIRVGQRVQGLHVLTSGTAKVLMHDLDGRELMLTSLGPREFFGIEYLLDNQPSLTTIKAHAECKALYVPAETVTRVLLVDAAVTRTILYGVAQRLRWAEQKMYSFAFIDVYGRVAGALLEHSLEHEGEWLVGPGCEQIAAMVGASREMVGRVVRSMISAGIVRRKKRRMIVLDRKWLSERAARRDS